MVMTSRHSLTYYSVHVLKSASDEVRCDTMQTLQEITEPERTRIKTADPVLLSQQANRLQCTEHVTGPGW